MNEKDLAQYRYKMAVEKLEAAKLLKEKKFYKDSISRSYYAIFTAARALLAIEKKDSAKHSGIISLFNRYFVKTELIDKNYSKILAKGVE